MARLRSSGHEPVAAAQAGHPSDGQGSSRRWRIACAAVGLFGVGSVGVVYYPGARAGLDARSEPTVRSEPPPDAAEAPPASPARYEAPEPPTAKTSHEAAGHGARAPAARASAPQAHAEDGDGAESDSEEETLLALQCKSTALTRDAMTMKRKQHRPVILRLQPGGAQRKVCDAATGPSYTLTPRGWEDAFGECLAAMTGFRVIAHNADGTCSRCDTFEAVDCEYAEPAAVLVIGSSAKASFECAGQRCGEVHEPLTVDGVVDTFAADYTGACFADDVDANGASVFRGDASAVPRTRFFWIPEAEAEDRRRALWERSALFAAEPPARRAIWDKVTRAVDASLPGDAAPSAVDDYTFLKSIILPIFQRAPLAAAVTVIQGDAFPKISLLPAPAREPLTRAAAAAGTRVAGAGRRANGTQVLLYVGEITSANGQVAFLRKLKPGALGKHFAVELLGGASGAAAMDVEEQLRRHAGAGVRLSPLPPRAQLLRRLRTAAGLISYASGSGRSSDGGLVYDALVRGLPLFLSVQAAPYLGLQCRPSFFKLTDAAAGETAMNRDLAEFAQALSREDKRAASAETFVRRELAPEEAYRRLCERLGLCQCGRGHSSQPWAKGSCRTRRVQRYENFAAKRWAPTAQPRALHTVPGAPAATNGTMRAQCESGDRVTQTEFWPYKATTGNDSHDACSNAR